MTSALDESFEIEPVIAKGSTVTIRLTEPLAPGTWTTLHHEPSGVELRWGTLPGDVNGDGISGPIDILALVDALNAPVPGPDHALDINRNGSAEPLDILRLIDLLNGAGIYEPWLGRTLP